MKLSRADTKSLFLELSDEEMKLLWACLRESFATLPKQAYTLRTGVNFDLASRLADELLAQMRRVDVRE